MLIILLWTIIMSTFGLWSLFEEYFYMSITMAFGSFIAGATSEGGGAVAFPVMTLLFKIKPHIARDFSLMIQSFGMTAAALTIFKKRIPVVGKAILISGSAAVIGNILAFQYIAGLLTPALVKIFFCSFWLSFVVVLVLVNRKKNLLKKEDFTLNFSNGALIFATGITGGIISGLTGSGLDILTFALLTLYFNICEKVATPTSVILMAMNSVSCYFLKENYYGGMSHQAFNYLLVCLPIVVIGAPLGAMFIKDKGRKFITNFLVASICIQYVSALIIIKSEEPIYLFSTLVIALGLLFFGSLYVMGNLKSQAETKKPGSVIQNLVQLFSIKQS